MSFNRLSYDTCSYKKELAEQVSHLSYTLDPIKYEHCNKCRHEVGLVGGTNVGVPRGNMVDIENDLFNINRPSTLCPNFKYAPREDGKVQGKEYIKPVQHPEVDANMKQLKSCQMFPTLGVPRPPVVTNYICPADFTEFESPWLKQKEAIA
jgi:hypothetical protein